jgi:tRNA A22 N-methylase
VATTEVLKVAETRWASDLTNGCVDVARRNVAHHCLTDRISVLQKNRAGDVGNLDGAKRGLHAIR